MQTPEAKQMLKLYKETINEAINIISDPQSTRAEITSISPVVSISPPQQTDLFAALNGKFSEDKIELTKRIFKSFTDNCPIKDKKLIEELKKKVIKDLGK
jgi:hypothetical protein